MKECGGAGTYLQVIKVSDSPEEGKREAEGLRDVVRQGILASSRHPAKGVRGWKSLQGRLSWEKKTFVLLSSFRYGFGEGMGDD